MNYLTLEKVNKSFGDKVLFEDINLTIAKGQKIALVAKNGSGKTTLLKMVAGEEELEGEHAKMQLYKGIRTGYLRQNPYFDPEISVLDAAYDSELDTIIAIKEYELALIKADANLIQEKLAKVEDLKAWDIESKIKEVLGKLKIDKLDQKVKTLSGGQRKRLALAKLIIDQPEFIILDEPTNHLDIDMIEWLEKYLQGPNITLFMVTHDRYFLERVCNEIVELDSTRLFTYRGNYSDYLEKKTARLQNEASTLEKTKKLYKRELNWIRRQPKARGTKAKSRVDKFYKIKEEAHKKIDDGQLDIEIESTRLGSKILEAHAVSKSYGDIKILESFSYKFKKKERVGVAGPNGVGKTSFVKLLTQEIRPDGGKVVIGDTVVFGHFTQDGLDESVDKRLIDVVRDIAEYLPLKKGRKLTAEQLCERFLFPRKQQQVYISQLSGGEKRRLHLLTVLMKNPNFLILDEPTNDLDIVTLNILEEYLLGFPGCLLIISHDRYFMDKLVDHLFVLEGDGVVRDFNGTYSEYKQVTTQERNQKYQSYKQKEVNPLPESDLSEERKLSYSEKKEYENLEKEIEKLEQEKTEIENQFLSNSLDNQVISELSIRMGEIKKLISQKEDRWLELAEYI